MKLKWWVALTLPIVLMSVPLNVAIADSTCDTNRTDTAINPPPPPHFWVAWRETGSGSTAPTVVKGTIESLSPYIPGFDWTSDVHSAFAFVMLTTTVTGAYAQTGYRYRKTLGFDLREDWIEIDNDGSGSDFHDYVLGGHTSPDSTAIFQIRWDLHEGGGSNDHGFRFYRNGNLEGPSPYTQPPDKQWTPNRSEVDTETIRERTQMPGGYNDPDNFTLLRYGLGLNDPPATTVYGAGATTESDYNPYNLIYAGRFHLDGADTFSAWDRYCP